MREYRDENVDDNDAFEVVNASRRQKAAIAVVIVEPPQTTTTTFRISLSSSCHGHLSAHFIENPIMTDSAAASAKRKLRPARKQVKPGDIDKSEGPQPGKEYS